MRRVFFDELLVRGPVMHTKRLFIVDAMALAFRSYHAISRPLTTSSGMPTQAIYGSLMFFFNLIEKEKPDYLLVASDCAAPTFRHDLYDGYKAHRKEMPEDLAVQIPYLYRAFEALGCPVLKQEGLEADDLIGSLVHQWSNESLKCFIVSGDKDFLQLVGPDVSLYSPKKGGIVTVTDVAGVKAKYGVGPEHVIDILALVGDTADNVPGVPGIGEKGAAKLIQNFGSLESIYENLDNITNKRQHSGLSENKNQAFLSRTLVTIKTDVDLPVNLEECLCEPGKALGNEALLALTKELEFKTLHNRVEEYAFEASNQSQESSSAPSLPKQQSAASDYQLITTEQQLNDLSDRLKNVSTICFDTETTGLDVISDLPIGVSLSWDQGQAAYIPLHEKHRKEIEFDVISQFLQNLLLRSDLLKVGHNLKFDIQMLNNIGITVSAPIADTMIASHLIDSSERTHNLDACCLRYLDFIKTPTSDLLGPSGSMLEADLNQLSSYACEDADYTLRLLHVLRPLLEEKNLMSVFFDIEMPLVPILAQMEQHGVFVDKEHLEKLSVRLEGRIHELTDEIYKLAGEEFNIRSTKQLQHILFEKLKIHEELGVKRLKKTKTGFSTDNSVLEQLSSHPLIQYLLEYRQVTKIKSTYVDTLPDLIKDKTGRIHTSFHQTGTATGRLSSSDPNMQNIPIRTDLGREIRSAFKAPNDSVVIISADYSQVELRILAALSEDESLKKAFEDQKDIHTATAAKIFAQNGDTISPDQRSQAKAINFGIIYGMGPQRLAKETGVTVKEAKEFIDKYFLSYPKIKAYIDQAFTFAKEHSYTQTISGRRRALPEIHSNEPLKLANAKNIAVNSPVQGSAADLIKIAMINLQKELNHSQLNVKMVLQVHDELVFECQRSEVESALKLIRSVMEHAMDLGVPLKVDVGTGNNWLEAH